MGEHGSVLRVLSAFKRTIQRCWF